MNFGVESRAGAVPRFLDALNDRQREAVLLTEGPLMVIAGAGSGKTKMLTSRIAYLIQGCHVSPMDILAVTFTNKAAGEMKERVYRTLNEEGASVSFFAAPEIGTFHSVCVRLLRREIARTPFTQPFVIFDDSDQLSLIKTVVKRLELDEKAFSPKGFQAGINRLKCDAIEPQEMEPETHDLWGKKLKQVYELYQKELFANNALDFGEILCMTYRLLRDHLDIREKYQKRYRYIHVDEYQDTNRAQYLMLSLLAKKEFGGHENICVVGDEDQSIYKWRGADIRNILDFETDYPGAQVVKLEQNYRSTKTVIQAASQLIRNNRERREKTLWTDNAKGDPIYRVLLPDERAEAELVISEIKRIAQKDGRHYSDFAVFYRTHAQSRQFEDALRRDKIPYQVVGGLRFYDRKEIKDILSYFRVILNQTDSVSLKRVINTPARGIGKTTLDKLEEKALESGSFWAGLVDECKAPQKVSAGVAKKLSQFVSLIERLRAEQSKLLLSELYHLILDETGYVLELKTEGTEEALSRIENLEEFDNVLQEFEEDFFQTVTEAEHESKKAELLSQFLEQTTLATDADIKTAKTLRDEQATGVVPSIQMMTLHSSKGLEFPVVFMVGLEEGLFPSVKAWEETPDEEIEEERRLCYVGMTRAREQLYMLHVGVRRIWGEVTYQEPSRFFSEIPDEYVSYKDLSYGAAAQKFRAGSSSNYGGRSEYGSSSYGSSSYGSGGPGLKASPNSDDGPPPFVGRTMRHPEYGLGRVLTQEGASDDSKLTVEFQNRVQRKFILKYAKQWFLSDEDF